MAFFVAALHAAPIVKAQDLLVQPTPFTALLDFSAQSRPDAPKPALPIWLESVQIVPSEPSNPASDSLGEAVNMGLPEEKPAPHTVFRIRLRSIPGLSEKILLRLFFDDRVNAHPTVTAWTETGDCRFASKPLGAGLELPVSETLAIPTNGANYLEIDVPGDGTNIRKAFLTTLKKTTVESAHDFTEAPAKDAPVVDPFGNPTPQPPSPENDIYLFGRIRATLEPGVIKLQPPSHAESTPGATTQSGTSSIPSSVSFEFNLESAPLLSFVALEILNADPLTPLQAWANDQPLGPVVPQYPDLADPAYTGLVKPLQAMRFQYAGWLRAQVVIPGSALKAGTNTITLQLPAEAAPVAVRAIELQLKHNWRSLDYTLNP